MKILNSMVRIHKLIFQYLTSMHVYRLHNVRSNTVSVVWILRHIWLVQMIYDTFFSSNCCWFSIIFF